MHLSLITAKILLRSVRGCCDLGLLLLVFVRLNRVKKTGESLLQTLCEKHNALTLTQGRAPSDLRQGLHAILELSHSHKFLGSEDNNSKVLSPSSRSNGVIHIVFLVVNASVVAVVHNLAVVTSWNKRWRVVLERGNVQLLTLCLQSLKELFVLFETFIQKGCQLVFGISVT